ncbi:unnamed protein product [Prorocentrum cordatum]|uniref:Uncharacterized protein n=1 Tax=Prorocentrum cordatum TaxID=2364126 RepID=A0ABN9R9Z5_9DINO|nr:unnamed protein product [Polarella glacialis]
MYMRSALSSRTAAPCRTLPAAMPLKQLGSWASMSPMPRAHAFDSALAGFPVKPRVTTVGAARGPRCMPNCAAEAPATSAAATSAPSMRPPAAITGTLTAPATARSRHRAPAVASESQLPASAEEGAAVPAGLWALRDDGVGSQALQEPRLSGAGGVPEEHGARSAQARGVPGGGPADARRGKSGTSTELRDAQRPCPGLQVRGL